MIVSKFGISFSKGVLTIILSIMIHDNMFRLFSRWLKASEFSLEIPQVLFPWQRWARWKCSCCAPLGAKWYFWRRVRILLNLGCNMGASAFLDLYWRWVSAVRILLFYDHVCQFTIKWKCSVSRLPLHFSRVWIAQPLCRLLKNF